MHLDLNKVTAIYQSTIWNAFFFLSENFWMSYKISSQYIFDGQISDRSALV